MYQNARATLYLIFDLFWFIVQGAGYHSASHELEYKEACRAACTKVHVQFCFSAIYYRNESLLIFFQFSLESTVTCDALLP